MILFATFALLLALLPFVMFLRNIQVFLPANSDVKFMKLAIGEQVSVLIPARNEASSIGPAIEAILANDHPNFEVLVLDDHSEDETVQIVLAISKRDSRVKLMLSKTLPEGWNGKQHACWQLANRAQFDWLLFLDADVRLSKDAISRCMAEQKKRNVPLISGFPRQETGTLAEKLLIPLMHYVLLGYLPIDRMRTSLGAGLAAGCGQLFFANKRVYMSMNGHSAIRGSRHDGIQLPRAFRRAGHQSDIFDATDIARCRMYTSTTQVYNGLLKNATEGIASPRLIAPFTVMLIGGSVLPTVGLALAYSTGSSTISMLLFSIAFAISYVPRFVACQKFQQSYLGASLHPLGVLCFVAIQWIALLRKQFGLSTQWRGRS